MEDQLFFSVPKTNKAGNSSIRVQKYTRIYSASRSKTRESNHKQKSSEPVSLNVPQKITIDMSQFSFRTEPIQSLEKKAKSLLYDVQSAESDRLELIRDLSTYDYNMSKAVYLIEKLKIAFSLTAPLPDMIDVIEENTEEENLCYKKICKGLEELSGLQEDAKLEEKSFVESFGVREISHSQILGIVFEGIWYISGVYMMISLVSDQWLEHLIFKASSLEGNSYHLNMKQKMSNNIHTKEQCLTEIKEGLLPFLCLRVVNQEISLVFDKSQSVDHYSMIIKVKGFRICNVVASAKSETQTLIEVPELEYSLSIPEKFDLAQFKSLKKLYLKIKSNLFYNPAKKSVLWGSSLDYFLHKERTSRFMNEDYIKSATDDLGNFTQVYTFSIGKHKVSCYWDTDKTLVKILKDKDSEDVSQDSKNFNFLEMLQWMNVKEMPVTLSRSLEFEYLLTKLFP